MLTSIKNLLSQAEPESRTHAPWDVIDKSGKGTVTIPIWREMSRHGRSRYVFGLSRPFSRDGKTRYAKTFGAENISDILEGLLALCKQLERRSDISEQDRNLFAKCRATLDALELSLGQSTGNGIPSPERNA